MYRLLVNSLPKSGTNLLKRCVDLLGFKYSKKSISSANILGNFYFFRVLFRGNLFDKNHVIVGLDVKVSLSQKWLEKRLKSISKDEYITGHLNFSEHIFFLLKKYRYKILHIIRDPRDVILSHIYYAKKEKKHLFHKLYKNLNLDEAIEITLSGGYFLNLYMFSFKSILKDTYGWIIEGQKSRDILVVKFEDLIGPQGGGCKNKQINTIKKIQEFLNIRNKIDINYISKNLYGYSHTFRKGKIYSWKTELTSEQIKKIEKSIGDYIEKFGYEMYY